MENIFRKILYYCDGENDVIDICGILEQPFEKVNSAIKLMLKKRILTTKKKKIKLAGKLNDKGI